MSGTIRFPELAAAPTPPPTGYTLIYVKDDDVLYIMDESGIEVPLGSAAAITQLSGEASAVGPGNATITLSNSAIIGKVLTGFTSGPNSPVSATDTLLQAFQKLQAQVSATTGAAITALTGDVTATGPGSVSATVATVGGSTASAINSATILANASTSSNTLNTIVRRDSSGNFSAGTITASLTGDVTGNVNGVDVAAHASRHLPLGADPITTQSASTLIPDQANATGTANSLSRSDHIHQIPSGPVVQIGTSNFAGSANSFSLSDHVHAHGNQTVGTLHAAATTSVNGFMSSADKLKLDSATSSNTPSTIVERDSSGNFISNNVSLANVILRDSTTNTVTIKAPNTVSSSYTLNAPVAQGSAGTYLLNDGSGNLSWSNPIVNIDGGSASSVYTASQIINGGTA